MNRIILAFVALFLLGMTSCVEDSEVSIDPQLIEKAEELNTLLAALADPPELFLVPTNDSTWIQGKKGAAFKIDPSKLETVDGRPLGENLEVHLLELADKASLVLNNAPTVSNGQLLESGGAFNIRIMSNDVEVKIKEGESLEAILPKLTEEEMSLYTGERNEIGAMNWNLESALEEDTASNPPSTVKSYKDTVWFYASEPDQAILYFVKRMWLEEVNGEIQIKDSTRRYEAPFLAGLLTDSIFVPYFVRPLFNGVEGPEFAQKQLSTSDIENDLEFYSKIRVRKLGWLNIDIIKRALDPTPIEIHFTTNRESFSFGQVYLVYKDFNGVLFSYIPQTTPLTVPKGIKTKVVAFTVIDGIPHYHESILTPDHDETEIKLRFKPIPKSRLKQIINQF